MKPLPYSYFCKTLNISLICVNFHLLNLEVLEYHFRVSLKNEATLKVNTRYHMNKQITIKGEIVTTKILDKTVILTEYFFTADSA